MTHDVFISHAVEDKQTADRVCEELEAEGVRCWIAPRDIPPGRDYDEAIVEAIAASRVLLLVLSGHSNASPHVKREVQQAFAEESAARVIPFRIEPVAFSKSLSYYLGSVQWIDASTPPLDAHLRRLVQHVRAELARGAGAPDASGRETGLPVMPYDPPPPGHGAGSRAAWWVAGVAAALLVVAAVVYFALNSGGPRRDNLNQVNANVTPATPTPTPTPNRATPTPQASPTPGPVRPSNRNFRIPANLRPLNANRVRPQ